MVTLKKGRWVGLIEDYHGKIVRAGGPRSNRTFPSEKDALDFAQREARRIHGKDTNSGKKGSTNITIGAAGLKRGVSSGVLEL